MWIRPDWVAPVGAAVSTRHGPGVSEGPYARFNLGQRSGDDAAAVRTNRAALVSALGLPSEPRWLRQVHGTAVATDDLPDGQEPEADAAVASGPGRVLAILTADCLPVLFASADGQTVGAAHAGWRGLAAGVLERTVERMPADGLQAWLGPAIGAASYEVGEDVRAAFVDGDAGAADAFRGTRPGHWLCDLETLARRRLAAAGVGRVSGGRFDTFIDDRLYSYRRDGAKSGRFASLIWTR
ncbi:peptidoglycan editing factor PgeF [Luteibacter sp. PPL554]